jgi:hypothetical protein
LQHIALNWHGINRMFSWKGGSCNRIQMSSNPPLFMYRNFHITFQLTPLYAGTLLFQSANFI